MKIDYASDLHFNHWMHWTTNQLKWEKRSRRLAQRLIKNGNGEVLILSGDFSEWNNQTLWILDEVAKHYGRVYFTFGNHDLYLLSKQQHRKYGDSLGRLEELIKEASLIPNVVPLVCNIDEYKGKVFAGDALWYLPKSQEDWSFYRSVSNDLSNIYVNGYLMDDIPRMLWKRSMDWYDSLEGQEIDVMVTHMPPVHPPNSRYAPNTCYYTDVPFLPNTKHWVCGHVHEKEVFQKAGVTFYMNCIGYVDEYKGLKANEIPPDEIDFGIKTFEIK